MQQAQAEARRAWLVQQAPVLKAQQAAERDEAVAVARQLGLPIRRIDANGHVQEVQRVVNGLPIYFETLDLNGATSIAATHVWPGGDAGYTLTGLGITVGIWDGGAVRSDHQELNGRTEQVDYSTSLSNHATHVAGTIAATGVNESARGIAYGAEIAAYTMTSDRAEMTQAAANGLRVSNHSYGQSMGWVKNLRGDGRWGWIGDTTVDPQEDYRFGFYDWMAREWDQIAYNAPHYLIVKAAGNDRGRGPAEGEEHWVLDRTLYRYVLSTDVRPVDGGADGYDTVLDAGNAKNVLTVGAVNDVEGGYLQPDDVVMTDFSAWGPTDDGRIKPDLVTNGVSVYSSRSSAIDAYGTATGTSMAAPAAAGAVALLLEHEQDLRGSAKLLASTYRALLIHAADEAGAADGPDYQHGWGLLNTLRAAQIMTADAQAGGNTLIREVAVAEGEAMEWTLESDGSTPLQVTAGWTDLPGTETAPMVDPDVPMLVNDLDLVVIGPGETAHYPWVLDPANPSAPATRGVNTRDNVEQVYIEAPLAGTYRVAVTFKSKAASKSSAVSAVQDVSVITTGLASEALPVELTAFDALAEGDRVTLVWHTATETNNAGFDIEYRMSDEGPQAWSRLAFIEGYGTTTEAQQYQHRTPSLAPGTYQFRLRQTDFDGAVTLSPIVEVAVTVPGRAQLSEAYPNPFNPRTQLMLSVPHAQHVRADVFDLLGRRVATLIDGTLQANRQETLTFDAGALPSGVYVIRVEGEQFTETRRVMLVK